MRKMFRKIRNIAKTKDSILHILLMLLKGESDD